MVYAFWNQDAENGRGGYEVDTRTELQLLPVSQHLQQTWRATYLQGDSNHAECTPAEPVPTEPPAGTAPGGPSGSRARSADDDSVPCTYCNAFFCASTASMGYGESE